MGREREDVRAALELLLTPKQYAYVMSSSRVRGRLAWIRMLVNAGIRYRCADVVMRERYYEASQELLDRLREEDPDGVARFNAMLTEAC